MEIGRLLAAVQQAVRDFRPDIDNAPRIEPNTHRRTTRPVPEGPLTTINRLPEFDTCTSTAPSGTGN